MVKVSEPARVANVPVVGNVTEVLAVDTRVVVKAPEVVRFPPMVIVFPVLATPVPPYWPVTILPFQVVLVDNVLLVKVSDPSSVASVPVVGSITLVLAVDVRVVSKAPLVVRFPPIVIVLSVFATPVPPYCPVIILPFHVVLVDNVLLEKVSEPARVAKVPVVGSVTVVLAVTVRIVSKAPLMVSAGLPVILAYVKLADGSFASKAV